MEPSPPPLAAQPQVPDAVPVLCGTSSPRRAARPRARPGKCGFSPGTGVGPRIHLIWPGQQKRCPGMLSSVRGGVASCASLFSCLANMGTHTGPFLLLRLSSAMLSSTAGVCVPILYPCSPSLPYLLLTGVPKQLWPPPVSFEQGEMSLAGAVPWGWDLCGTRSTGQYHCSLSNLGSPQLSGPDAEPGLGTATFTLIHWQVPGGTGVS